MDLFILNQFFSAPIILGIIIFLSIFFLVTLFIVAITNIIERNKTPFVDGNLPYTLSEDFNYDIGKPITEAETDLTPIDSVVKPKQIESTLEATVKPKRKYTRKPKEDTIPAPRKREPKTKPSTIKKVNNE